MKEQTKGKIISVLIPRTFLLGKKLGKWYEKNPYHKFDKGDILILRDRRTVGYGIRPVAVVNGYEVKEDEFGKAGKYSITMHRDREREGDFFKWATQNEVPQGIERTVSDEIHFKWNIENQFKKVRVKNIDEALVLYASRKVEQQERAA